MSDRGSLAKGEQSTCFVIMPFGHPFDRYYRNIFVPAIQSVGMSPVRADSIFLPSQIIGDIWRFTLAASIVLADVSGKNANVFYELGLAHASGKPVVIVTSNLAPGSPPADPTRMMTLLDRHTALLHGVTDGRKAAIFESLMAGDVAAAAAVIREELQAPPARADEIARNIFDWMKLYKAV